MPDSMPIFRVIQVLRQCEPYVTLLNETLAARALLADIDTACNSLSELCDVTQQLRTLLSTLQHLKETPHG